MIDRQKFPDYADRLMGAPRQALRKGLQDGFQTFEELNRFSMEVLSIDLREFSGPAQGTAGGVEALMTQMDQDGRLMQLVSSARAERPRNGALREVEEMLALTFDPFADVQDSPGHLSQKSRAGVENVIVASAGFASADDFLSRLAEAEFRVCYIAYSLPGGEKCFGTGFLIGSDLLMTNEHVIDRACGSKAPFTLSGGNFEIGFDYRTSASNVERTSLATNNWLVASDPGTRADGSKGLDYAILRLSSKMGEAPIGATSGAAKRGFFRPVVQEPAAHEPLLILQHPFDQIAGKPSPMRLTIGFVTKTEGVDIRHTANTLRGSSGSPVFNSHCEVIGLHYWGDHSFNAAKKMEAIRDDLATKGMAHLFG